ncbi:MAG TPA: enoyl-CoA hydratase-related protein [Candidatus Limnocylindrales bacterium]
MSLVDLRLQTVALLTLNNPPLNIVTDELIDDLESALQQLEQCTPSDVRALIVTGSGNRAFSVGSNVKNFEAHRGTSGRAHFERESRIGSRLAGLPMPAIAALEHDALGGGLELALCCDLRVASEAANFGMPEVRLAVTPGTGGTQRLPRIVGLGRAMELLVTGRVITAKEAHRIGLVNEVVPAGAAVARAKEIGAEIAERGPLAVREVKTLVNRAFDWRFDVGMLAEVEASERIFGTEDMREGARSFVEKRHPKFKGT